MPMYSQRLSPAIFASTPAGGGDRGSLSLRSTSLGIEATRFIQKKTGNNRLSRKKCKNQIELSLRFTAAVLRLIQ